MIQPQTESREEGKGGEGITTFADFAAFARGY